MRALREEDAELPTLLIAERVGWSWSMTWFRST